MDITPGLGLSFKQGQARIKVGDSLNEVMALLQEELVVRAEEEDAERSVEQAAGLFGDEPVRRVLAVVPHDVIPLILR